MTYRSGISGSGPVRGAGPATWALLGVLAATATVTGCYKPNLADGKLLCGPAGACPDGYACVNGLCWQGGIVSPPDGGGVVDMAPPPDLSCFGAVPECTVTSTGVCDPVCQTGCGCQEKCSVSSAGEAACVPVQGQKAVGAGCNVMGYQSPAQTDDCVPGAVCLYPGGKGTTRAYCFALCSSDTACPNSRCVPRPVSPPPDTVSKAPTANVCDTPFTQTPCNPFDNTGCVGDLSYCYLAPPDPVTGDSRTQCEYFPGPGGISNTCDWSRECFPKFACPRNDDGAVRPGAGFCLPVCDSTHPCMLGRSCKPYGNTYGYCVTT